MRRSVFVALLAVATIADIAAGSRPKLVLYVSVDQMRSEYPDRYQREYTGAFKRFAADGIFYSNADLNYASSETGPGHATLSTGTYPAKSGIYENHWAERLTGHQVYCVDDSTALPVGGEGGGFSPVKLLVPAIGDWLKKASPNSKVIAASGKNRAAILMGGKRPDHVYWYGRSTGHMVTSSYYTRTIPEWVTAFNNQEWVIRKLPPVWEKLLPDSVYAVNGPDDLAGEMRWNGKSTFPHYFRQDKRKEQILDSPFQDQMILDFARAAIQAEQLGQRGVTDLLCLGLSATDYIGHNYGPDSHEQHDNLLRLDIALGTFIADIEALIGRENLMVVLSADHACMSLPEHLTQVQHKFSRRIIVDGEITPKIRDLNDRLQSELRTKKPLITPEGSLNYKAAAAAGISSRTLEKKVRQGLLKIDGIVDVYFQSELRNTKTPDRPYLQQYRNSFTRAMGDDFKLRYLEHVIVTRDSSGTEHGSPYRYDTHIPIFFWGPKFRANRVNASAHTVDIAPTIARYLGIPYPRTVDGKPLLNVLE